MQDNNQIIKLFPGELGVEAFYTEREAVLPPSEWTVRLLDEDSLKRIAESD